MHKNLTTECPFWVSAKPFPGKKRDCFVQFDSKPESAALLTGESYIPNSGLIHSLRSIYTGQEYNGEAISNVDEWVGKLEDTEFLTLGNGYYVKTFNFGVTENVAENEYAHQWNDENISEIDYHHKVEELFDFSQSVSLYSIDGRTADEIRNMSSFSQD